MSGTVESPSQRFINHYQESIPPKVELKIGQKGETHVATSTRDYRISRHSLLYSVLSGESPPSHETMTHALIAEQVVNLALRPMLAESGFRPSLAPQSLEHGVGQKGVDLLISDAHNTPYLGIDVKLRYGNSSLGRDGFGWNPLIRAPYIYLSLGNWKVDMREKEGVGVKEWLRNYSVPGISKSGQIPRLDELREYLLARIEKTLYGAHTAAREPQIFPFPLAIPANQRDIKIMREKAGIMHHLFTELRAA